MKFLPKIHAATIKTKWLAHPHNPKNGLLVRHSRLESGCNYQIEKLEEDFYEAQTTFNML